MIPCKKTCADYYEGCHKNCERWKHFLQQSSAERKEKKAYLNAYNELCSTIVRQCRANTLRHSYWAYCLRGIFAVREYVSAFLPLHSRKKSPFLAPLKIGHTAAHSAQGLCFVHKRIVEWWG